MILWVRGKERELKGKRKRKDRKFERLAKRIEENKRKKKIKGWQKSYRRKE